MQEFEIGPLAEVMDLFQFVPEMAECENRMILVSDGIPVVITT
jgi:hypothetical protein